MPKLAVVIDVKVISIRRIKEPTKMTTTKGNKFVLKRIREKICDKIYKLCFQLWSFILYKLIGKLSISKVIKNCSKWLIWLKI